MFDKFPYTNFHELNLDYFINKFNEIFTEWEQLNNTLLEWKAATDTSNALWKTSVENGLAAWKTATEADLNARETALRAELAAWKTATEADIGTWETDTLAALNAWKTTAGATFEAIRVQAAASATAAQTAQTAAETAQTAAETAQTAAETAAANVTASAAQIQQNADDIDELKTQFDYAMDGIADEGAEVSGNIITVDSADGSVDYISVDASGAGTSVITRCGKNIYPKYSSGSSNGLSWTVAEDGTITFSGTPTADVLLRLQNIYIPMAGQTFTVSFNNNIAGVSNQLVFYAANPNNVQNVQVNLTAINTSSTKTTTKDIVELRLKLAANIDWTGLEIKPMLVMGGTAEDFEEYNGQTYNVTLVDGVVQENIPLLTGTNTIWASNGDITVKFEDVPNKIADYVGNYVAEQIEPLCDRFFKYTVSGTTKKLNVCFRSGDRYIAYELHNMPADRSNSNTWQLGQTDAVKFNDDWTIAATTPLIDGGEYELAMRVHWTPQSESDTTKWDYCGGNNHGDENTVTFKLFIDGKQISDLDSNIALGRFNRIDAFEIATVNMPTNDSANNQYPENANIDIAEHQKHWTFENGKVEVQQSLKFLQDLSLDVVLLCLCCARSEQFPYGIRQGRVGIEDMSSESGFSHITTRTDDASYFYYGNNATLNIKADTDAPSPYSALYINSVRNASQSQNKLYYGYYQATNSGNPTQVHSGDTIRERSEYNAAFMS